MESKNKVEFLAKKVKKYKLISFISLFVNVPITLIFAGLTIWKSFDKEQTDLQTLFLVLTILMVVLSLFVFVFLYFKAWTNQVLINDINFKESSLTLERKNFLTEYDSITEKESVNEELKKKL